MIFRILFCWAFALAFWISPWHGKADSTVVFNEIHYHPSANEPENEWVELHNQMAVNMDLSGWKLARGIDFQFAKGTVLRGGGYLVVALNPESIRRSTGLTNVLGPFRGRLSNSGETLELRNNNDRLMDSIRYGTDIDWPVAPDGHGPSLSKHDPDMASGLAVNWKPSSFLNGTPGAANFPNLAPSQTKVLLSTGGSWAVHDLGTPPGDGWNLSGFVDTGWKRGSTPFYGGDASPPIGIERSIPGLYGTGVGDDGNVLTPGSLDPHYTLTISAQTVTPRPPAPARVIDGHPAWLENDSRSRWLGPLQPGTQNVAAGKYRYSTRFDLTGFNPTTARIQVQVAADNRLNDILLNGTPLGKTFEGFTTFSPIFTVQSGFVAGQNTLEFLWANDGNSPNPAGFRALVQGSAKTEPSLESRLSPLRRTIYLRSPFHFDGTPQSTQLLLRTTFDDGALFYLNGVEVFRGNLPVGSVDGSTPATVAQSGIPPVIEKVIPGTWLRNGTNWLAVELHQAEAGTEDLWFDAELIASDLIPPEAPDVVLNEIGHPSPDFFVELANRTEQERRLDGYRIQLTGSDDETFTIPSGTVIAAYGVLAFPGQALRFRPNSGDHVVLRSPGDNLVLDAAVLESKTKARFPDGGKDWFVSTQPTPSEANRVQLQTDVVINEIQYHPREGSSSGAWVELFNRGTRTVDLSGWHFDAGIEFLFAPGSQIQPNAFLVLAQDPLALQALYPGIEIVGPYTNNLSRRGERLILRDAIGNPADMVEYADGGRWPEDADGSGPSLELRDPFANNGSPEAWAASRDSDHSNWKSYSYRTTAVSAPGPTRWNEFILGLLDRGECLIDDLRVVESPTGVPVDLLQNGTFESGSNAWRFLGTHRLSRVIPDPTNPANRVLHLVATGPTEHMHNHLETTLANGRTVTNGRTYDISFRAKWLSGNHQLNTRLYFNRAARTIELDRPIRHGTPGQKNSSSTPNIGPTFRQLQHTPTVPAANQPVTITAHAEDPQGIASARVFWSVNGGTWQNKSMEIASNGTVTATIPSATAGAIVQFYLEANDGADGVSQFPARGRDSRALFGVEDRRAQFGKVHNLRILMTPGDRTLLHASTNVMSNEFLGATVIYDERQVFYEVGAHLQGSQRGRLDASRVGFTLRFSPDNRFRGVHDSVSIDRSGGYTGVGGDQDEILIKHALQHAGGLPGMYDDLVRVLPPRTDLTGSALLIMAKYGDEFLDTQFENGSDGNLFKLELIYYPTTTTGGTQGFKLPQPDEVLGVDIRDLGNDPEVYRWFFLQENNRRRNDYSQVMALAKALNKTGAALDVDTQRLMDIDTWMRAIAFQNLWGMVDTFPLDNPHNFILYFRPSDGRVLPFLWDMDFNFGASATSPLNRATGNLDKVIRLPGNQRRYLGHLLDLINTTYNVGYLGPWITHFGELAGQNFSGIRTYVDQRSRSVRSQLPANVPFAVTFPTTEFTQVETDSITVTGRAWIDIKHLQIEGVPTTNTTRWTTTTSWQLNVPLQYGTNTLRLLGYDFQGQLVVSNQLRVFSTDLSGLADTDQDGMPNSWEVVHGLDPATPDGSLDADADGFNNLNEFLAGTNPKDATSLLRLEIQQLGNQVRVKFPAKSGRSYSLLSRNRILGGSWNREIDFPAPIMDQTLEATLPTAGPEQERLFRMITPRLP